MTHELILHHYDMSPYAEKIRLCLGRKGLAWRAETEALLSRASCKPVKRAQ